MYHSKVSIPRTLYSKEYVGLFSWSQDVILRWDFHSAYSAVIDSALAEFELFLQCKVLPFDGTSSSETKLLLSEDIDMPRWVLCWRLSIPWRASVFCFYIRLFFRRKNLLLLCAVFTRWTEKIAMLITNPRDHPISLPHSKPFVQIKPTSSILSFAMCDYTPSLPWTAVTSTNPTDLLLFIDVWTKSLHANLDTTHRRQLLKLVHTFPSSIDCRQASLSRTPKVAYYIDSGTHARLGQWLYRAYMETHDCYEYVDDMLKLDVMRPSQSHWSSPVV